MINPTFPDVCTTYNSDSWGELNQEGALILLAAALWGVVYLTDKLEQVDDGEY